MRQGRAEGSLGDEDDATVLADPSDGGIRLRLLDHTLGKDGNGPIVSRELLKCVQGLMLID